MYQLNNLGRPVLITPKEVLRKSPGSDGLSESKVEHSIEIAEERFIRPALGSGLYDALCAEKNCIVTSANLSAMQQLVTEAGLSGTLAEGDILNASELLSTANRKLWDGYLWKLVAECVRFTVIPEAYSTFTSSGIVKNNPVAGIMPGANSTSVGISLQDAKWQMDVWMSSRIDPLLDAMHRFICKEGGYAGYARPCACEENGAASTRKTDWVTGIYDDDENPCSCY